MTSGVLKSHLADDHVHNDIQNIAFGYLENWGDCQIWNLNSVTSCVFKNHLADVHPKCSFMITSKKDLLVYLWEQTNCKAIQIMQKWIFQEPNDAWLLGDAWDLFV